MLAKCQFNFNLFIRTDTEVTVMYHENKIIMVEKYNDGKDLLCM